MDETEEVPPAPEAVPGEKAAPAATLEQRLEALLFLENRGLLELSALVRKCGAPAEAVESAIARLNAGYRDRDGVLEIIKLESGFRLTIRPDFADPVLDEFRPEGKRRMTRALLETLVIIAYKQPITRSELEAVRGVNSAAYIKMLLDDDFVKIAGRKKAPGSPVLYKTTPKFLLQFGLKSLADLPTPRDVKTYEFLEERAGLAPSATAPVAEADEPAED